VIQDKNVQKRHHKIARATRKAVQKAGLTLYLDNDYCSTVTAINVPNGINGEALVQKILTDSNILIGDNFGYLKGKVVRIGHMGENARPEYVAETLKALQMTLEKEGVFLKADMEAAFLSEFKKKKSNR